MNLLAACVSSAGDCCTGENEVCDMLPVSRTAHPDQEEDVEPVFAKMAVTTGYSTTGHLLHRQQGVGGTSVFGGAVSSTSLRSRSNGTGAGATTFSESYFERELPELRSLVHEPRPNSEYRFKSTGAVYSGQWLGKERHGLDYADGDHYCGQFERNLCHGVGVFIHEQTIYYGEWRQDLQHGHGVETWGEGSRYEGEFEKGEKHGHGTYTWADGSSYEGTWVQNRLQGHGMYIASEKNFRGEWSDSLIHGLGIYRWGDGRAYAGSYLKDRKHGFGTFMWPDGRRYEGNWADGKQDGAGIYTRKDGTQIRATWSAGKRIN
eukprot:g11080.t1